MQYEICDVWCVICDVPDLIFFYILTLCVKGRPKIHHLGNFRSFKSFYKSSSHVAVVCTLYLAKPLNLGTAYICCLNFDTIYSDLICWKEKGTIVQINWVDCHFVIFNIEIVWIQNRKVKQWLKSLKNLEGGLRGREAPEIQYCLIVRLVIEHIFSWA